ncbi:MAG: 3-phosphoshikimate 1-carboxyvinyltransferase [Planctomycetota bacterium]|jgi:3-phosphoshikimate 1-carboxyvinyltransferase
MEGAKSVRFEPVRVPVIGSVRVPGSKSITNRALVCAAMAVGQSHLSGVLESEDTEVMVRAWQMLGLQLDWNRATCELRIAGCAGHPPNRHAEIHIANSGTSVRFLTAALAATQGEYSLDGVPRMRERPIGDLLDGLRAWGVDVRSTNVSRNDCPPVLLRAAGLRGGRASVRGEVSSQFLSGMLLAAPYSASDVVLTVDGDLVSKPYVAMTLAVMHSFGVQLDAEGYQRFRIPAPQQYHGIDYAIEPDASAASYFLATAAITGGKVRVLGLSRNSLQGDVGFADVLEQMGCSVTWGSDFIEVSGRAARGIDINMNAISDTVQTLSVVALFAEGSTRIRGVSHNRHKETDRIGDLATELRRLGADIDEQDDGLIIHPRPLRGCELTTYRDHRMAMSLTLAGLRVPEVRILDPACTGKTYPKFFEDLGNLLGQPPQFA